MRGVADGRRDSFNPVVVGGGLWDAIVHRVDRFVIVEFEPRDPDGPMPAISGVLEAIRRLSVVKTVAQLREDTVEAIAELTGFDRVMLYHFHPDGHGEVVGERHRGEAWSRTSGCTSRHPTSRSRLVPST